MGHDWIKKQQNPPHILIRYAKNYYLKKSNGSLIDIRKEEDGSFSANLGNNDLYWLLFCFDLFVILHKKVLPEDLLERLRDHKKFQGARYELAVAAIFLRAGFDIEWIDKNKQIGKSCEFVAVHKSTGIRVGVEAKSRKRKGTIHEAPGEHSKQGIANLLKDAEKKRTPGNIPLVIFIDINLPYKLEPIFQKQMLREVFGATETQPGHKENYAWLVVTNFAFHYDEKIFVPENITVFPLVNPWLNPILRDALQLSIKRYCLIPEEV